MTSVAKKIPPHVQNFWRFLSEGEEKANEDMALQYFRDLFPYTFTRQSEANHADGYVPGHFVLELKGKKEDWLKGLMQALAYKQSLNFSCVVIAAKGFVAIWNITDLPTELLEDVGKATGAPNEIGRILAVKYHDKAGLLLENALWQCEFENLASTLDGFLLELSHFDLTLRAQKKVRQKITIKNFVSILPKMAFFFSSSVKAVRAFYGMLHDWSDDSKVELNHKYVDSATLKGAIIQHLIPEKRLAFKHFVERYYFTPSQDEHYEDFFAHYDRALDTVDKNFRIKNGIFFTDLDLAKFAMWNVKQNFPDLGNDYLVIDPACGSGNLITSWRSPLDLKHKIVSEIEPELLYTVERRMKGDEWHTGKFTIVPKTEDERGLNFLDISAQDYIDIFRKHLSEKGCKLEKPLAFLCNPPYRGSDDQSTGGPDYEIHPSIVDLIGKDAKNELYNCFLAQMRQVCFHAEESGISKNSLLLLFTKIGWLTERSSFHKLRKMILQEFKFVDGFMVDGKQFFDIKGRFPIAFTMWRYQGQKADITINQSIRIQDLTWITKKDLAKIPWGEIKQDREIDELLQKKVPSHVLFDNKGLLIKNSIGQAQKSFKRSRRKSEKHDFTAGGLPIHDKRLNNKCAYGEAKGQFVGFMDNLTPCRIAHPATSVPWFRLNPLFMDCRKSRCFSGLPTHFGYCASDYNSAKKTFLWFALSKIFDHSDYPMWADAFEMWEPIIPTSLEETVTRFIFAIGLADNECIETCFPANNPIAGAQEIHIRNPLAPTNRDSFWSKTMAPLFQKNDGSLPCQLVRAVENLYQEWEKQFDEGPEIIASYERPYFIGTGYLRKTAGLIQIHDYAEDRNHQQLKYLNNEVTRLLKMTKESFSQLLRDSQGINYFGNQSAKQENCHMERVAPTQLLNKASQPTLSRYSQRKMTRRVSKSIHKKKTPTIQKVGKKVS